MVDQNPDAVYFDLVHTLLEAEAEAAVQGRLKELTGAPVPDVAGLMHLRRAVWELADQAQFVLVTVLDSQHFPELQRRDGSLVVFFREAEQQIALELGEAPGVAWSGKPTLSG